MLFRSPELETSKPGCPADYEAHESFAARDDAETEIAHFEAEAEVEPDIENASHADHAEALHHELSHELPSDLTEEEAAALSEHVAEAQSEAAALQAEAEHSVTFTDVSAVEEDTHIHESNGAEDAIVDIEEHELDDEESEDELDSAAEALAETAAAGHEGVLEEAPESEPMLAAGESNGAESMPLENASTAPALQKSRKACSDQKGHIK